MQKWLRIAALLVFGVVAYLTLFYQLGDAALQLWDEARLANNTLEMLDNGNLLVTYYNGEPDMWNTKPPLLIWIQSISASIFGLNVWALRFPSALAGLLTAIVVWKFCSNVIKNWWMGFFSALALVVYPYFAAPHVTLTADYDAMLILFTTGYVLLFYTYVVTHLNKYLYLTAITLTLAILTKGVAGVLFLPFIPVWLLLHRELTGLLENKHFYFSAAIVLVVGLGYYFLREAVNPGYFQAVVQNELGGRFNGVIEGHSAPWWIYGAILLLVEFVFLPTVIGLVIMLMKQPKLGTYIWILCVGVFIVLTFAQTRILWYLAILYPLMLMGLGYMASLLVYKKQWIYKIIGIAGITYVIVLSFKLTHKFNEPHFNRVQNNIAYADYIAALPDHKNYKLVSDLYFNGHTAFYSKLYNKQGYHLQPAKSHEIEVGDTLMLCEPDVKVKVAKDFNYHLLDSGSMCILVMVYEVKTSH